MKNQPKSFVERASNFAAVLAVLVWTLNWCFTSALGAFVLLTLIGAVGSAILVGGAVNATAWYVFNNSDICVSDQWWLWVPCLIVSAFLTLCYMAHKGIIAPVQKAAEDDED